MIMNICYSELQTKAIKTLLYNQDLDNENIQLLKKGFKNTDTSDMTLEEAQSIIDKMSQAKKDAANNILLGKVRPLQRYSMEGASKVIEQMMKECLFLFLFFIIVVTLLGGHTYIGAGVFLCWLVYLLVYTDYILPRWIRNMLLLYLQKKGFKAPLAKK